MNRLFIAVDISAEARKVAAERITDLKAQFPAKGVSWVRPANLHITLKFLGDANAATLPVLNETVRKIAGDFPSTTLIFSKPEVLEKRVISIGIESETRTIFDLEKRIDTQCSDLSFEQENRRFHPHLTLGRIRNPHNKEELVKKHLQTQIRPVEFEVREIVLYESELNSTGSVYTKLTCFPLFASVI